MTDDNPTSAAVRDAAIAQANELRQVNAELREMLIRMCNLVTGAGSENPGDVVFATHTFMMQARALIERTK